MKIPTKCFVIITGVMVVLPASLTMAQQPTPEASPPMQMQSPSGNPTSASPPTNEQGARPMQKMDKMAESVTKISEMCQMMMTKEMAGAHYKMAAGITIGVLLVIALVLFVVLEVQWTIYWGRILRNENRG
jgi:hypothetical protein